MQNPEEAAEIKKKRTFRKFSYRGIDLDQYVLTLRLLDARTIPLISARHTTRGPHKKCIDDDCITMWTLPGR